MPQASLPGQVAQAFQLFDGGLVGGQQAVAGGPLEGEGFAPLALGVEALVGGVGQAAVAGGAGVAGRVHGALLAGVCV